MAEHMEEANRVWRPHDDNASSKIISYRTLAVLSLIRIAWLRDGMQSSSHDEWSLPENFLVQVHADNSILVKTLVKGIRHALDLNAFERVSNGRASGFQHGSTNASITVQPLVSWLSSLGTTLADSSTTAKELQDLVGEYGDVLMDGFF